MEKWIVIIVKDAYLKSTLIKDIEFKKTTAQQDEEMKEEEKRIDDERPRKCPKCFKDYMPKDTKFGDCHYHDGFIIDPENSKKALTVDQARIIMQRAAIIKEEEETSTSKTPLPKLLWTCCGHFYGENQSGCRISSCGLPEELKSEVNMQTDDYMAKVEEYFMQNADAITKRDQLMKNYKKPEKQSVVTMTLATAGRYTDTSAKAGLH